MAEIGSVIFSLPVLRPLASSRILFPSTQPNLPPAPNAIPQGEMKPVLPRTPLADCNGPMLLEACAEKETLLSRRWNVTNKMHALKISKEIQCMIRYRRANKKVGDALEWDVDQVCQWLRDEPESGGGGMPQLCKVSWAVGGSEITFRELVLVIQLQLTSLHRTEHSPAPRPQSTETCSSSWSPRTLQKISGWVAQPK